MIGRTTLLALFCGLLAAAPVAAEVSPVPLGGDPRIQTVVYDPQEVVALSVTSGFAVTIVFSPDERIETVTVGDSAGWLVQVNRRADALVVKPVGYAPVTNMTVMSDQRSYNFVLRTAAETGLVNPYLLRFSYVVEGAETVTEAEPSANVYRLKGAEELWPDAMSDDGEFTYVIWGAETPFPAVYHEDESGNMALVNGAVRDGAFVIEGVYDKLIFIRGKRRTTALRLEKQAKP